MICVLVLQLMVSKHSQPLRLFYEHLRFSLPNEKLRHMSQAGSQSCELDNFHESFRHLGVTRRHDTKSPDSAIS